MHKNELTGQSNFNQDENMKNENNISSTEAEASTYTDLTLRQFSAACSSMLEALKNRLIQRFTAEFSDVQVRLVRQAVDEALALATLTLFPHLVLHTLAEEKVQSIRNWSLRQRAISQPQRTLAGAC